MATFINPYTYISDPTRGRPVFNGRVFLGNPDTDPTLPENQIPVSVVNEDGTLTQIPQPVRTGPGGVATYQGNPVQLDIQLLQHSMTIQDAGGRQVYYAPRINIAGADTEPAQDILLQYNRFGTPRFITSAQNEGQPFPYPIYARVVYNAGAGDRVYESLMNNNITIPTDTDNWRQVDFAGRDLFNDNRYLNQTMNLADLTNTANARTNLELGTAAVRNAGSGAGQLLSVDNFSQVFSTSGRVTFPNGFIIQWLSERSINNNQSITLTYPIAFPNACRFACAQTTNSAESDRILNFVGFPGTSSAVATMGGGSARGIRFIAFFGGN